MFIIFIGCVLVRGSMPLPRKPAPRRVRAEWLNVAVKDAENLTGTVEFSLCLSESKWARVELVLICYRLEFMLEVCKLMNDAVVLFVC